MSKPDNTGGWTVLDLRIIGNWIGKDLSRKEAEKLAGRSGEVVYLNPDEKRIYINTPKPEET